MLVGFFTDAGGRPGGLHLPLAALFQHHRTAVVKHRAVEVHGWIMLLQIGVHGVAAGVHLSTDQHDVADVQGAHLFGGQRRGEHHFAAGQWEAFALGHLLDGHGRVAIEPVLDGAGLRIENHAQTPERPAVVGDRDEEAGRQTVGGCDLAANQARLAAEAHGADAELVGLCHDLVFELRQDRVRIGVFQRAEELILRERVARGAVRTDADADGARRAALALRLPDGVQDALLHAREIAAHAAEMFEFGGEGVLDIFVFAAAALEDQLDLDFVLLPLFKVNHRGLCAEIIAGVLARERVD